MLQNNLWTERGLVNGAFATLRDVPSGRLRWWIRRTLPPTLLSWRSTRTLGRPGGQTLSAARYSQSCPLFHVNLAYAITVHKSQGVTLDRAVVDITDQSYEFSTGLRYVGVSRVRSLRGVVFQKTFALDDLQTSSTAATMEARLDDREKRLPQQMIFGVSTLVLPSISAMTKPI
ncbi:hypothetical protein N7461_003422 [Penicillium sp. DV-2018c]|nr:hypothetical protein N7461_003422 [Penicillium sp. DV-2018c]